MFTLTAIISFLSLLTAQVAAQSVTIQANDNNIRYNGQGWALNAVSDSCLSGEIQAATTVEGDSLELQVVGATGIVVYGAVLPASGATFLVQFDTLTSNGDVSQLPANASNAGCSELFNIPNIDSTKSHILTITNTGPGKGTTANSGTLSIDQILFLQNPGGVLPSSSASVPVSSGSSGSSSASSAPLTSSSPPTSSGAATPSASSTSSPSTTDTTSQKKSPLAVIIAVILGILITVSLVACFIFHRRRRNAGGFSPRAFILNGGARRHGQTPNGWSQTFFERRRAQEMGVIEGQSEKFDLENMASASHSQAYLPQYSTQAEQMQYDPFARQAGAGSDVNSEYDSKRGYPDVPRTPLSGYSPGLGLEAGAPKIPPRPEGVSLSPYDRFSPSQSAPNLPPRSAWSIYSDRTTHTSATRTKNMPSAFSPIPTSKAPSIRTARTDYSTMSQMSAILESAQKQTFTLERPRNVPVPPVSPGGTSRSARTE